MRVKEPIQRLHYMDSLRSVAMFLGLVLHAGVFFAYWPIDPKVPHADASMSIHYLKESIHTFRMELFFLVAGFFSAMLCRSRGLRGFLSNRIQRIVIPFGLCVLLMEPWIVAEYFLQNSFSNETFWFRYFQYALNPSYLLESPQPLGNWFWHFWFLHLLAYFAFGFSLLWRLGRWLKIRSELFYPVLRIIKGPFGIILLSFITLPVLLLSPPWADVPGIGSSLDVLVYYGLFFGAGALFYVDESVFDGFKRQAIWHVVPFLMALGGFFYLVDELRTQAPLEVLMQDYNLFATVEAHIETVGRFPLWQNPLNGSGFSAPWEWYCMCLLRAYTTWCGVVFFIVLFRTFCQQSNALSRYASDASYFVYLIHFPVQFSMARFIVATIPSAILGFWICLVGSTLVSLFLYHFFCRNTWLGVLLNGRRHSRDLKEVTKALVTILRKRKAWMILMLIMVSSFVLDRMGDRNERLFLTHALTAQSEALRNYAQGQRFETLAGIQRPDGRNALHMASHHMRLQRPDADIRETVSLLLELGFTPDSEDSIGQTALHYALRFGNIGALDVLLDAGANPNAQERRFGQTPMHMAAIRGDEEILDKLSKAGAQWDLRRRDGATARELFTRFHSHGIEPKSSSSNLSRPGSIFVLREFVGE